METLRFFGRARKPYLVGANYRATHAAHRIWQRWDADAVEKDLALAESTGINALRTFFRTPELCPVPGVVSEEVLGRFDEFLRIASAHHVDVFPTFFVDHMAGVKLGYPVAPGTRFLRRSVPAHLGCRPRAQGRRPLPRRPAGPA
jgi:endo-1,4-beta-mannosidase